MNMAFGLDRLVKPSNLQGKIFVGRVLSVDYLGRIKCQIDPLFEGLSESDLPWIQMSPSNGCLISPKVGSDVLVEFRDSIYEGFYRATYVNSVGVGELAATDLGESFVFNMQGFSMHGKYDGTKLTLDFKNSAGVNRIVTVTPDAVYGGPFCALKICPLTGAPHQGRIATGA